MSNLYVPYNSANSQTKELYTLYNNANARIKELYKSDGTAWTRIFNGYIADDVVGIKIFARDFSNTNPHPNLTIGSNYFKLTVSSSTNNADYYFYIGIVMNDGTIFRIPKGGNWATVSPLIKFFDGLLASSTINLNYSYSVSGSGTWNYTASLIDQNANTSGTKNVVLLPYQSQYYYGADDQDGEIFLNSNSGSVTGQITLNSATIDGRSISISTNPNLI